MFEFKDVGASIKKFCKVIWILMTALGAVLGIAVWIMFANMGEGANGFCYGAIIVAIAYVVARLAAMTLYAYGEMAECVKAMKQHFVGVNPESTQEEAGFPPVQS